MARATKANQLDRILGLLEQLSVELPKALEQVRGRPRPQLTLVQGGRKD